MSRNTSDQEPQLKPGSDRLGERLVYVMPENALERSSGDGISLRELWIVVWRRKWWIIAVTAVFAFGSAAYAISATEWYRSEALLAPAEEKSTASIGGQLGGLAALAGVSVGGNDSIEALATLRSRDFARDFIEEFDLLPVFYADIWDAEGGRWIGDDPMEWPDIRDATKFFQENVLIVSEDPQTRLVTLAIEWTDPEMAATWVDSLVSRLNTRLRLRSLRQAETNVEYLQSELVQTSVISLQQSIGRLLESELQKLMLARGNEEFAFRIIDEAIVPKVRERPRRTLITILGAMLGGMFGVIGAFLAHAMRSEPGPPTQSDASA